MTRSFQPASYSAIQSVYSGIPSAQSYGNLGEVSNSTLGKLELARQAYKKSRQVCHQRFQSVGHFI